MHNLGLLELFGLLDVVHGQPEPGEGWRVERVSKTPLGNALLALLANKFFNDLDYITNGASLKKREILLS